MAYLGGISAGSNFIVCRIRHWSGVAVQYLHQVFLVAGAVVYGVLFTAYTVDCH